MKALSLQRAEYTYFVVQDKSPAVCRAYLDPRGKRWYISCVDQRVGGWLVELRPYDPEDRLLPGDELRRTFRSEEVMDRVAKLTGLLRGTLGFVIVRETEDGTALKAVFLSTGSPPEGLVPDSVDDMPVEVSVIPFPQTDDAA